ncbi:MAG: hypothetical protein ABH887_00290, partial [bacterium]
MQEQQNKPVVQGSKNIWTIIAPVVLITAIVVGGGMWYWQKTVFEKEKEVLQEQIDELQNMVSELLTTQEIDVQQENEFADWKIYTNEEYGFEVKYPEDWKIREEIPQPANFGNITTFYNNSNKEVFNIQNPYPEIGFQAWTTTKTEEINIQNSNTTLTKKILETKSISDVDNLILASWFSNNSGMIRMSFKDYSDKNIEIFDQILSTFKFIE